MFDFFEPLWKLSSQLHQHQENIQPIFEDLHPSILEVIEICTSIFFTLEEVKKAYTIVTNIEQHNE